MSMSSHMAINPKCRDCTPTVPPAGRPRKNQTTALLQILMDAVLMHPLRLLWHVNACTRKA